MIQDYDNNRQNTGYMQAFRVYQLGMPVFYQPAFPFTFNLDFAVEIVARVSNTKQKRVSGYFLDERIVCYFESKKCSERLCCEGFGNRSRFQLQNLGLIIQATVARIDNLLNAQGFSN